MATALEVLEGREARQAAQLGLLRAHGLPVVSFTAVSPGPDKDDRIARDAFEAASRAVDAELERRGWGVRERREAAGPGGPEFLLAVGAEPHALKGALVALEERAPLGRLWDLDVVCGPTPAGLPQILGRRELGLAPRRCLVCADEAAACARSGRHALPVVLVARRALAAGLDPRDAGPATARAVAALVEEARLTPKPGLVDAATPGAHDDMDLPLLERSAEALRDWFAACWLLGALEPGAVEPLVTLGIAGEEWMNRVTGGVNTHRGALFGIGLLMAALGAGEASGTAPTASGICARVARLAEPLLEGWLGAGSRAPSHGAGALATLGLTGARGEAASGFATVQRVALPAYRVRLAATGDRDDALRWTLLALIAENADTNLVARGGSAGLAHARAWARGVLASAPDPETLVGALARADADFTARRLSPGGSADLLAITVLLERMAP